MIDFFNSMVAYIHPKAVLTMVQRIRLVQCAMNYFEQEIPHLFWQGVQFLEG